MARRMLSTTVYLTREQDAALKTLHARTKVPIAEYIRQGIDYVISQHRSTIEAQQLLPNIPPSPRQPDLFGETPAPPRRRGRPPGRADEDTE
jgi:hypothetical protein